MKTNPTQTTQGYTMNVIAKAGVISAALLLLAACDSGSETVQNPFLGSDTTANQGPPAATEDVRAFEISVWNNLKADNRCGECHGNGGQSPNFADPTDVNVAYSYAVPLVNLQDPGSSLLVTKVGSGHNCWEAVDTVCADSIEQMIVNWAGGSGEELTARVIQMTAPTIRDIEDSKTYPVTATENGANSFEQTVYPLLIGETEGNCGRCHYEEATGLTQSPFFANPEDVDSAYEAAKPKINIDTPEQSRFVRKLLDENHNCWTNCTDDAAEMQTAIEQFAGGIQVAEIDSTLVTSKALIFPDDGIVASGGNRHESNLIALWEFKTGTGNTAYDTSGIEPAMNLSWNSNNNDVAWLGAYGLDFTGGRAQATTTSSKKLHDFIKSAGEYSIEAWTIPANVTQEDATIIGYGSSANQNFALSQTLYNYNFFNRCDDADACNEDGQPFLSTEDAGEILQSSLQHVVATYNPISGRKIYVNGELINVADPIDMPTAIASWNDGFAFSLGNSTSGNQTWLGKLRMVAIHNRELTDEQVIKNFEVGVGQKYYFLFSVADKIGIEDSYIRFEVSQFDSYAYLFEKPTFINLDPDWTPVEFTIKNIRIGLNSKEAIAGQSFANLEETINANDYSAAEGQVLSSHGAVIALEKGAGNDMFFLTFEMLGSGNTRVYTDPDPVAPLIADADPVSDIGVLTFEEINATIAKMTGIPVTNNAVNSVYQQYKQQLPTTEAIDAFLSSHQMAIAQLALTSCSERVDADAAFAVGSASRVMFTDFDFSQNAPVAFDDPTEKSHAIDPILHAVLLTAGGTPLANQPDQTEVTDLLGSDTAATLTTDLGSYSYDSLITEMTQCPVSGDPHYNEDFPCTYATDINTASRTREIVKALCAAAVGSAAMLIQ